MEARQTRGRAACALYQEVCKPMPGRLSASIGSLKRVAVTTRHDWQQIGSDKKAPALEDGALLIHSWAMRCIALRTLLCRFKDLQT